MIAEFHLRAWSRIPEVEIFALANRTVARAAERATASLPGHVLMARDAALHIICQQPLRDSFEDARRLVADTRRAP